MPSSSSSLRARTPSTLAAGVSRQLLAAEVSRLCLVYCECARKAVIIAPTVPLIKQHFDIAKQVSGMRVRLVIGCAEVDAWDQQHWHEVLTRCDILLITPRLFLDALDSRGVGLGAFCVMVVAECHHCKGNHPLVKLFSEHYSRALQLRILGLSESGCLFKRTVKSVAEREQVLQRLSRLMDSHTVLQLSCAVDAGSEALFDRLSQVTECSTQSLVADACSGCDLAVLPPRAGEGALGVSAGAPTRKQGTEHIYDEKR